MTLYHEKCAINTFRHANIPLKRPESCSETTVRPKVLVVFVSCFSCCLAEPFGESPAESRLVGTTTTETLMNEPNFSFLTILS